MSYYANELREHGRNDFDEAAADELDRLEDENSKLREVIKLALDVQEEKALRKALPRAEFLELAMQCGAVMTGKPDASEPIEIVFSVQAWRQFDATLSQPANEVKGGDLDFTPDKFHTIPDMANVGYSLMQAIKSCKPDYCWNESPTEIVCDLINEIDEFKADRQAVRAVPLITEENICALQSAIGNLEMIERGTMPYVYKDSYKNAHKNMTIKDAMGIVSSILKRLKPTFNHLVDVYEESTDL